VIGVGGGLPQGRRPDRALPFVFFGLAGVADFNYPELRALDQALAALGAPRGAHALETFEGGHEWAPPERLGDALEWLDTWAMRRDALPRDQGFLAARRETHLARVRDLAAAGDPAAALARCEQGLAELDGLTDVGALTAEAARLSAGTGLARAADEERRAAAAEAEYEQRVRFELRAILGEDPDGLNPQRVLGRVEVPRLRREAEKAASLAARRAARRSLETLFVQVGYYMPRELERRGEPARAAALLDIATAIHPEAEWAWYELARQRALARQPRKALAALRQAVDSGYADGARLAAEPAFAPLRDQAEYREIARRLRGAG
jgi:tetratricopeptide (TPR) repeat protein